MLSSRHLGIPSVAIAWVATAVAGIGLLIVAGVSSAAAVSAAAVPSGRLDVAVIQPTTGPLLPHNVQLARGIAVAADMLNRKGGIGKKAKLNLLRATAPDASGARALVSTLKKRGADVLILPCDSGLQPSLARAGATEGMLMLAPCNTEPKLAQKYRRYWPVGMAGNAQAAQIAAIASGNRPASAFVIERSGSHYVRLMTDYFRDAAKLHRVQISGTARVNADGSNAAEIARQIEKASPKPQFVFTALHPKAFARLVPGLRANGMFLNIYGTDVLDAGLVLTSGQWKRTEFNHVTHTTFGFPKPSARAFEREFERRYGEVPASGFARLGQQSIRVLEQAVITAGSVDPLRIDAALARGMTVYGEAASNSTYPGSGRRFAVTDVGFVNIVDLRHVPFLASTPQLVPRP